MELIHPTAIVSPKAQLGNNVKVGPFAIIHDNVIIDVVSRYRKYK